MVTFDICKGNPGALAFLAKAYKTRLWEAEAAFQKLQSADITGDKIYMLWNDCCNRNTDRTIDMILDNDTKTLEHFINYENGRGLRYCPENYPDSEVSNAND